MSALLNPGVFQLSIVSGMFAWATIYYMLTSKPSSNASHRWIELLATIHIFRYIGMIAFVPKQFDVEPLGLDFAFQLQAGIGDWVAGALAMLTIVAVRQSWSSTIAIAWVFSVLGLIDNLNAAGTIAPLIEDQNIVSPLGWLVVTIYVPGLLLSEAMLVWHLVQRARGRVEGG